MKFFLAVILAAAAVSAHSEFQEIAWTVNNSTNLWTAEVPTRFGNLSDVSQLCGNRMAGDKDYVDPELPAYESSTEFLLNRVMERADGLDWRTKAPQCTVISKIRDQSACGSCWAFGSTETFEDRRCIATGKDIEFSTADTAGCCKGLFCGFSMGCGGGQQNSALKWMTRTGVVTGGDFGDVGKGTSCKPYPFETCAHHVDPSPGEPACPKKEFSISCEKTCTDNNYKGNSYDNDKVKEGSASSIGSVAGMVTALEKGPISVAFTVYADFPTYKSGVYHHTSGSQLGGHAVEIIGYGSDAAAGDYWVVKNSWNSKWGDGGTFKIKKGVNECGIESQAGTVDF